MKTQLLRRALLPLLAAVWLALTTFAQETADRKPGGKHDEIVLLLGSLMVGKVTAIAEEHVEFVHQGETLPYQVKKHTVHRINFASGRSEVINPRVDRQPAPASYQPKTVAVLPLFYLGEGNDHQLGEMPYRLQQQAYDYLRKEARELKWQDPTETNARLLKNGVNAETFRRYTAGELAQLLGVEYVVSGRVTQETGNTSTYTNATTEGNTRVDHKGNGRFTVKDKAHTTGLSTTATEVKTSVDLAVHNVQGEKLFNQSRKSILSTGDAYKNALHYLLKRTPLYGR